jgi:hypothetical protein
MTQSAATLSDQAAISEYKVKMVADMADRGILHLTVASALVGRSGSERHAISMTVWAATPERDHPMAGYPRIKARPVHVSGDRTYCGSQRFGSGAHSYSLTEPVTCERCLGRAYTLSVETMPLDVLEVGRRGEIAVKA